MFEADDTRYMFDKGQTGVADAVATPSAFVHSRAPLLEATWLACGCGVPLLVHAVVRVLISRSRGGDAL